MNKNEFLNSTEWLKNYREFTFLPIQIYFLDPEPQEIVVDPTADCKQYLKWLVTKMGKSYWNELLMFICSRILRNQCCYASVSYVAKK